jgi:hypothetical protein
MTLKQLQYQLTYLRGQIAPRAATGHNMVWQIGESLNAIREELLSNHPIEATPAFARIAGPLEIRRSSDGPYTLSAHDALRLCDQLLSIFLRDDLTDRSSAVENQPPVLDPLPRLVPPGRKVFVIHGHDEANTLRLRILLRERFRLNPIILAEQPNAGRALIEKFEEEAVDVSFVFALVTPDDLVQISEVTYGQARPNVVFELGWFYGRLGRNRVCILLQEGSRTHSDLDGVVRIQFRESIEEKLGEIERELDAAGLIKESSFTRPLG